MTDAENITILRPNSSEHRAESRPPSIPLALAWPAGLFLVITFSVGADMAADLSTNTSPIHLAIEMVALALALVGVFGTGLKLRSALHKANTLQRDLEVTRADAAHWRNEAQGLLRGLGAAIDRQFERWGLTSAEREVSLLILKGLSYKEVADARGTAERTVRHQALAIYRKAGLAGRAEMAAFFLEDLLLPARGADEAPKARQLTR
jgi:DNA-binding CsgD family transcriptional regulator